MSGRAHQSFPKADLLSRAGLLSPYTFPSSSILLGLVAKDSNGGGNIFEVLLRRCVRFGVLVLLASLSSFFSVPCYCGNLCLASPPPMIPLTLQSKDLKRRWYQLPLLSS